MMTSRHDVQLLIIATVIFVGCLSSNYIPTVNGFSSPGSNPSSSSSGNDASFTLFDRFQAKVPADLLSIRKFDPRLVPENEEDEQGTTTTWVAVYRSSNNLPSVLVRDEFLDAMRVATTVQTDSAASMIIENKSISDSFEKNSSSVSDSDDVQDGVSASSVKTPVAIAKLVPSKVYKNRWVIEALRCSLKKEDTNEACDGGSEHVEALSVCLDELIIHHLKESQYFGEGGIRCKGTLVSSKLLEDRGFVEVSTLEKDMATHLSSFDGAMKAYAERAVTTVSKNPGSRERALKILSLLGRSEENQDSDDDDDNKKEETIEIDDSGDDDEYDPWGSIKQFYSS